MPQPFKVQAADLYIAGGQKIGELTNCTVSIKSNGERVHTSEGVVKSKGQATADVDFEGVVPRSGMGFNAFQATIDQEELAVAIFYNGQIHTIDGTFDEATMKSVVQSGMTTGTFKFSGGCGTLIG